MLWQDVTLETDNDGREFLQFSERLTKTRDGNGSVRAFMPKLWENADKSRCPVAAYKVTAERRPEKTKAPECRFFISINQAYNKPGAQWFKDQPMGEKRIARLMSDAAQKAGIAGRMVNHSGRKTAVKRLLDSGCPPSYVTGHKNVASLQNYSEADMEVQRKMSATVTRNISETATSANSAEFESPSNAPAMEVCGMHQPVFNNCSLTIQICKK